MTERDRVCFYPARCRWCFFFGGFSRGSDTKEKKQKYSQRTNSFIISLKRRKRRKEIFFVAMAVFLDCMNRAKRKAKAVARFVKITCLFCTFSDIVIQRDVNVRIPQQNYSLSLYNINLCVSLF